MSPPPSQSNRAALTKIYTEALGDSDSEERKEMMFQRPEGMTNITQLYTAALKEENRESGVKVKPKDEKTNPIKHNLATRVDKAAIMEAYNDVMADNNNIEWAAFTFSDNKLGVAAKGVDFAEFKSHFGADDRGFGYIKITTGDEMSKR